MYQANNSAQDKTKQRNDLQRDMIMKGADYKKIETKKLVLLAEIRRMESEEKRMDLEIGKKKGEIEKIDQEARMVEIELKNIKKKMNLI